ncbi:MAG: D-alanyl-D-alanine carboxypeptidase, partial [Desulfobacterales bacterium]
APNGALCANFNTVFFRTVNGQPQSAEAQTPLLPMVRSRIRRSGLTSGRIVLSRQGNEAVRYAGHLFRYFLEQEGITTRGEIRLGVLNITDADLLYRHRSPYDLRQVIRRLLEFSNNFTANQLLLAMGAHRYGPPATLEKGRRALNAYARDELGLKTGVFVEGSGISRLNRLSVRDMDTVLRRFAPHADLMSREGREYYKTGTLKGIRTRAGYIEVRPGVRFRFSLFRNQRGRTTGPVMRQIHHYLSVNQ